MKLKTNKSALKRFKITKKKMMHRPIHQNHFNAKDCGQETRNKRGFKLLSGKSKQNMQKLFPYN